MIRIRSRRRGALLAAPVLACLCLVATIPLSAQPRASKPRPSTDRLITKEAVTSIVGELSGTLVYQDARRLEGIHRAPGRYEAALTAANDLATRVRGFGLREVQVLEQPGTYPSWNVTSGDLWMTSPQQKRLTSFAENPWSLAPFSRGGLQEASIVDAGRGVSERDYRGVNVSGNLVLASGPARLVVQQAVWRRGALGVICYSSVGPEDAIKNGIVPLRDEDDGVGAFAYSISRRQAREIQALLSTGSRVTARSRIDANLGEPGKLTLVEAIIPGENPALPEVLLTARLEEYPGCTSSGSTGCAALVEVGRVLSRLVEDGTLPRPRRTLRFWWTSGLAGVYGHFGAHPDQRRRTLVTIHADSLGESVRNDAGRIENATALVGSPLFHPTFADDLSLAFLEEYREVTDFPAIPYYGFLDAGRGDAAGRPILVHDALCDATIGVSAISFVNLAGRGARPPGGSLTHLDPANLGRECAAVATLAYGLAALDAEHLVTATNRVTARVRERLPRELDTALRTLGPTPTPESWLDARSVLLNALIRERNVVASVAAFAPNDAEATAFVAGRRDNVWAEGSILMKDLTETYTLVSGVDRPKDPKRSRLEGRVRARIPEFDGVLSDHLAKRQSAGALSSDLAKSLGTFRPLAHMVLSCVDGRRTYPDIFRLTRSAEILASGRLYGETVDLQKVSDILDAAQKAGALRVRENSR